MNIPKAIEILDTLLNDYHEEPCPDETDSIKLGIEALKRIRAWRNDNDDDFLWELLGETEED